MVLDILKSISKIKNSKIQKIVIILAFSLSTLLSSQDLIVQENYQGQNDTLKSEQYIPSKDTLKGDEEGISGKGVLHPLGRISFTGSEMTNVNTLQGNIAYSKNGWMFYSENTVRIQDGTLRLRIEGGVIKSGKYKDISYTAGVISFNEIGKGMNSILVPMIQISLGKEKHISGEMFVILPLEKENFGNLLYFPGISWKGEYKNISYTVKQSILCDKIKIVSVPTRIKFEMPLKDHVSIGGDCSHDRRSHNTKVAAHLTHTF